MFSLSEMSSTMSNLLSACASLAGSLVLIRTLAKEIPDPVWSYLDSGIRYLFTPNSNQQTIVIDQHCCGFSFSPNQIYDAAEIYLRDKISPSTKRFKVTQPPKQKNLDVAIEKSQELFDKYENINLKWRLVTVDSQSQLLVGQPAVEKRSLELRFHKKFKDRVLDDYLPSVLKKSKEIKDGNKVVKLYTPSGGQVPGLGGGAWGSIILDHPATFDTLAMEQEMKKMIVDDLDRFVKREKYYKKAGRAWKRGYLLYGPPGTGKSSLIAAMANHLKFDVYDLDLTILRSNSTLKSMLMSTTNRSIIVIEDIDCNVEMQDRKIPRYGMDPVDKELTLSGLLNLIDGLLSSCGEERIIVFTTNHKDVLDPALLRPGRMDMHIEMSYCTFQGFKQLASIYLDIQGDHRLFGEIEGLIENVKVTPAEVAGELMKIEDPNNALDVVVKFLKRKHMEVMERKTSNVEAPEAKRMKVDGSEKKSPTTGRKRGVKVRSRKR